MTNAALDANARTLLALRDANGKGALPEPPADLAGAYGLQFAAERLLEQNGFKPIGWKIGATNAGSRAMFKLDAPFLGRLFDRMTDSSPARLPAAPGFYRAYEAEFALQLGSDLDGRAGAIDAAAVRAATKAIAPAIEMVGGFIPMAPPHGAFTLIADRAGHGRWILGAAVTDIADIDLDAAPVTFTLDGETKATGKGANVDGGPFGATAWLANELGRMGRVLKAGEWITTGTAIPPVPFAGEGKVAVADFGALGKVEVTIG